MCLIFQLYIIERSRRQYSNRFSGMVAWRLSESVARAVVYLDFVTIAFKAHQNTGFLSRAKHQNACAVWCQRRLIQLIVRVIPLLEIGSFYHGCSRVLSQRHRHSYNRWLNQLENLHVKCYPGISTESPRPLTSTPSSRCIRLIWHALKSNVCNLECGYKNFNRQCMTNTRT